MVLADTAMPYSQRASAMFSVVRRDHFSPVMGSPAVSCSSKCSMMVIIRGVFFPWEADQRRNGACGPSGPRFGRAIVGVTPPLVKN